ncbi:PHD finger protein MALE MEIOCYTE DEATH 1 [Acorus calamus]|uniref:PHD finger protein MALE MEIOCYTE DEATH 1 n=1 Tax=Acorus calamus TaxID=4465 RepID=A0AAV9EMD0_ACOCL|nr:PHD finger protein MALE MEIOCYTE DEATH 1 [Acorus calamus]
MSEIECNDILYGAIHSNGAGHLLSINGHENGSVYRSSEDVMKIWDDLCALLRMRVHDVLKKKSIELLLLFGVAYRTAWFGNMVTVVRGN